MSMIVRHGVPDLHRSRHHRQLIAFRIKRPTGHIAEESIIVDGDRVITLSEANGKNVNPLRAAKVFSLDAEYIGQLPMPQIEYRVTDATALDSRRRFPAQSIR